jgi:hypothetical protein
LNEHGNEQYQRSYQTTSTLAADGTWLESGSSSGSGSELSHYDSSGTGTYSRDENGESVTGTVNEDAREDYSRDYQTTGTLPQGGDWIITGSGSGSGSTHHHQDRSGSGTYTKEENDGIVNGSISESGQSTDDFNYTTQSTLSNTLWTKTGTGSGSANGESHYSYSGSGTYSSGSGSSSDSTFRGVTGTVNEDGSQDSGFSNTSTWTLNEGTWGLASGSGNESGSSRSRIEKVLGELEFLDRAND